MFLQHVFKVIDRKFSVGPRDEGGLKANVKGNIGFKKVSFRYPTPLFSRVSASRSRRASQLFLSGPLGHGRALLFGFWSTFLHLRGGLWEDIHRREQSPSPSTSGNTAHRWASLCRSLSSSKQPSARASATGNPAPQTMRSSLRLRCPTHNFIMKLHDGCNTPLGSECGAQLSGGQKQRITIACAFICSPLNSLLQQGHICT